MAISITNCIFKNGEHAVTFNYTKNLKTAQCSCGNHWVPVSPSDTKCKKGTKQ